MRPSWNDLKYESRLTMYIYHEYLDFDQLELLWINAFN